MRLERIQRWQWMVLSIVIGAALAYARRSDPESLLSRLGEGVADQRWLEQELLRKVPLADGSSRPAFGRLTVYPMTVREGAQRKTVHVVAGMYLTEGRHRPGPQLPATAPASPTGKLRPYFYIAPVPFQPLADRQAGKPAPAGATVTDYLDDLKPQGVTYAYAWWADARYAAAAWVGGSFLLVGVVWPTCVNLLAFGTLRRPRESRGVSLWRVKASAATRVPQPLAPPAPSPAHAGPVRSVAPAGNDLPLPTQRPPATPPPALVLEPVAAGPAPHDEHKEFGAGRDDFYPTELKAPHPAETHGARP
jgi:hypothetical protein